MAKPFQPAIKNELVSLILPNTETRFEGLLIGPGIAIKNRIDQSKKRSGLKTKGAIYGNVLLSM